jgi:hypothetical protein
MAAGSGVFLSLQPSSLTFPSPGVPSVAFVNFLPSYFHQDEEERHTLSFLPGKVALSRSQGVVHKHTSPARLRDNSRAISSIFRHIALTPSRLRSPCAFTHCSAVAQMTGSRPLTPSCSTRVSVTTSRRMASAEFQGVGSGGLTSKSEASSRAFTQTVEPELLLTVDSMTLVLLFTNTPSF